MSNDIHEMSVAEAEALLATIGYREGWTVEELRASVPADMAERFKSALRITADALNAEANRLLNGALRAMEGGGE